MPAERDPLERGDKLRGAPVSGAAEATPAVRAVRVVLPAHLRTLANAPREVSVDVIGDEVTQRTVLDALEASFPMLRGTVRDHATKKRRPFVRFFVGESDLSHGSPDDPLPAVVATGDEPFYIIGAMAGG